MMKSQICCEAETESYGSCRGLTSNDLLRGNELFVHAGHTTVIVLPLTTQLTEKTYPLRYSIPKRDRLMKDSELLCDQIRAVDINRITPEKLVSLTTHEMLKIEQQIQIILDFTF